MLIIATVLLIVLSFCNAQTIYSQTYDGSNDFNDFSDGDIVLIKSNSGEYLNVDGNGDVELSSTTFDQESMLWKIDEQKSGYITFKNRAHNLWLRGQGDDDIDIGTYSTGGGSRGGTPSPYTLDKAEWIAEGEVVSGSYNYRRKYVKIKNNRQGKCISKLNDGTVTLKNCNSCGLDGAFTVERMNNDGSD